METDRETQLLRVAYEAGITSPTELANFMAQVSAESGGLSRLNESFRYTRGPEAVSSNVRSALREGPEALSAAWQEAMNGSPERLAELMYGGRMGNNEPGDGYKYHGRGYIQLTGKNQYRDAGEGLELDVVNHPELAAEPGNAARIAVWYWQQNVQALAPENVREAGSIINTGQMGNTPNGLGHREAEFAKWQRVLTPEIMEQLARGEIGAIQESQRPQPKQSKPDPLADGMLHHGGKGNHIRELQQNLRALGYTGRNGQLLAADGDFGANTEHAVRAFQRDHGLKVDGIAGPRTVEKIREQPLVDGLLRSGKTGQDIRGLQKGLYELGYKGCDGKPLVPDGDFGPNTEHAVRAYQRDHGLRVDGIARSTTLNSIREQLLEYRAMANSRAAVVKRHRLRNRAGSRWFRSPGILATISMQRSAGSCPQAPPRKPSPTSRCRHGRTASPMRRRSGRCTSKAVT